MSRDEYWSSRWLKARANMPRVNPKRMGSPTVLKMLLGYKITMTRGSAQHIYTASNRGDRPRDARRRQLLEQLAGPYGIVLAKAIAANRKLDLSRYKYWPDGKGGFNG